MAKTLGDATLDAAYGAATYCEALDRRRAALVTLPTGIRGKGWRWNACSRGSGWW